MPDESPISRRRLLELLSISSIGGIAGCTGGGELSPTRTKTQRSTPTRTARATPTAVETPTESPTAIETPTETPRENPNTIFVGPEGSRSNEGTRESPIESVRRGLLQAKPGEVVYLLPGKYHEHVKTVEGGEPNNPITIAGPPQAELHGAKAIRSHTFEINHSHIHIRGITLTGLHNPSKPDTLNSYIQNSPIITRPPLGSDEYLKDIVIKPSRLGYSRQAIIWLARTKDAEVGEFEVIGRGGAPFYLTGEQGHNGEIVYVGTSPANLGEDWYPWTEYDRTSDVWIHHIDNSAGHSHSEIVNTKLGTHDITVEYCTDGGGSYNTYEEHNPSASVRLQSYGATVRWCDLRNGKGQGVEVASYFARNAQEDTDESNLTEEERRGGMDNEIYLNKVTGFEEMAFRFPLKDEGQTPDDQSLLCGNRYDGQTDGNPDKSCPPEVPEGDGIGHLGGDSPWA